DIVNHILEEQLKTLEAEEEKRLAEYKQSHKNDPECKYFVHHPPPSPDEYPTVDRSIRSQISTFYQTGLTGTETEKEFEKSKKKNERKYFVTKDEDDVLKLKMMEKDSEDDSERNMSRFLTCKEALNVVNSYDRLSSLPEKIVGNKKNEPIDRKFRKKVYVLETDPTLVVVQYLGEETWGIRNTKLRIPAHLQRHIEQRVAHEKLAEIYRDLINTEEGACTIRSSQQIKYLRRKSLMKYKLSHDDIRDCRLGNKLYLGFGFHSLLGHWVIDTLKIHDAFPKEVTSNAIEGMNNLFKQVTDWKSLSLDRLILKINDVQRSHIHETIRGCCGLGDYKLKIEYSALIMDRSAVSDLEFFPSQDIVDCIISNHDVQELNGEDSENCRPAVISKPRQKPMNASELSEILIPNKSVRYDDSTGTFLVEIKSKNDFNILSTKMSDNQLFFYHSVKRKQRLPLIVNRPNLSKVQKATEKESGIQKTDTKAPTSWDKEKATISGLCEQFLPIDLILSTTIMQWNSELRKYLLLLLFLLKRI
ncbi:unnamed protein product, partial [Didymodactylos carnosus]